MITELDEPRQPWFADLDRDFTAPLLSTPKEQMPEVQAAFNFPYDLAYDPLPAIGRTTAPRENAKMRRLRIPKVVDRAMPFDL